MRPERMGRAFRLCGRGGDGRRGSGCWGTPRAQSPSLLAERSRVRRGVGDSRGHWRLASDRRSPTRVIRADRAIERQRSRERSCMST